MLGGTQSTCKIISLSIHFMTSHFFTLLFLDSVKANEILSSLRIAGLPNKVVPIIKTLGR